MNVYIATAGLRGERPDYTWVLANKPTKEDVIRLAIEKDGWADPNDPINMSTYTKELSVTIKEVEVIDN